MTAAAVVCVGCGAERERAIGPELPGHTTFAPCAACGERGIVRAGDLYEAPRIRKPNRVPYHMSPYRGGRLVSL